MEMLKRFEGNPILKPIIPSPSGDKHLWESWMVFNCGAIELDGKVHIIYRARALNKSVSRLGYASSKDGFHIDERLDEPIFVGDPVNELECLGCEDPRLTRIGDEIYMCYTAYGLVPGSSRLEESIQIGMTSISVKDFLAKRWEWKKRWYPFPRVEDKNACLFPEKIKGKWAMLHRISPYIWLSYSDDLRTWKNAEIIMSSQEEWEYFKVGNGAPPIKTDKGWLVVYHGVSGDYYYRLGLALLDLDDPSKVLWRSKEPVLSPVEEYEKKGIIPNVVFTCGAVVRDGVLFVYYGCADTVIGVATCEMKDIMKLI